MRALFTRKTNDDTRVVSGAGKSGPWLILVVTLPTANAEARMKILRTLDSMGAGVLREGTYLMPDGTVHRESVERLAEYIGEVGGTADLIYARSHDAKQEERFRGLFDRAARYEEVVKTIRSLKAGFGISDPSAIARVLQRQRTEIEAMAVRDYFPGPARDAALAAVEEMERAVQALMFPSQATNTTRALKGARRRYFQKTWATRLPLWADRLASAWLIRRFIDVEATLVWLGKADPAPEEAVTYGYEGAEFANSSSRLTFEQLLTFFKLDGNVALARIGTLTRALETGDASMIEAKGVETMLQGARHRAKNDRQLLTESEKTFDLVYETYLQPAARQEV
jgi:hypothetical protein